MNVDLEIHYLKLLLMCDIFYFVQCFECVAFYVNVSANKVFLKALYK